jgi:N-acetylneuraminate synthase
MIKIIAEIGINHNGSLETTKKLIDVAKVAGCNYVKFQKRTPELCVPEKQKNVMRSTPWGDMTYIDYKHKIEFEKKEYDEIALYCEKVGIKWFASVWDEPSVDFMKNYADVSKIPSALITKHDLLKYARDNCDTLLISTGMSVEKEIEAAVEVGKPDVIFHTNSSYPSNVGELNLNYIHHLKKKYGHSAAIGYSGHEFGLITTFATVPMGVEWIERHITLDRTMWGSDQMASVEPHGLIKLVKGIRNVELALGHSEPRIVMGSELKKRLSLRGN